MFWTLTGVAGTAAVFIGAAFARFGLRLSHTLVFAGMSVAIGLLGVAPARSAAVVSALIYGPTFMAGSALLAVWSYRVFEDWPTAGLRATVFCLGIGTIVGPALAGPLADQRGLCVTFVLSAAVGMATCAYDRRRSPGIVGLRSRLRPARGSHERVGPMADSTVTFGYFLIPNAADPLLETASEVERLGLEYIGIQDHPYQRRFVDTFALMSAILARTTTLRVFPDVACLPLRPPGVLAKTAASLDVLSGGRFELGLGAGAFWDAVDGYGGTRRTPAQSLDQLAEAIAVIRQLWSGERGLRFEGDYYHLRGVHSGPPSAHDMGIWVGAQGPKALRLTGQLADGWVPSIRGDQLDKLAEMNERVDAGAAEAGRDPGSIRRVYNVNGSITGGASEGYLRGPVSQWVDQLGSLVTDYRAQTLIFWGDGDDQLRRFAEEVVPAARVALGEHDDQWAHPPEAWG